MPSHSMLPPFANPASYWRSQVPITRAEGVYFWDDKGTRYLDGVAGVMVVNVGHGNREIIEAMKAQLDSLAYNFLSYSTSEPAVALTKRLTELLPGDMSQVFYTTGGSEATDTAIKIARLYHVLKGNPKRYRFVGRWISYHGATLGALSASGHAPRRRNFEPLLLDFPHAAPAYCYRCPFGKEYPSCGVECAESLEQLIRNEGPESIAAFIAEPIVGSAGGALVPPDEYFKIIREICDKYGILLVLDEVLTGFGRTGRMFAAEHWNVRPDMVLMAKGMSSGYAPIGGVGISGEIAEVLEEKEGVDFAHGFTFAGSPVAAVASLKNIEVMERDRLSENSARVGKYLLDQIAALDHRYVGDVRGRGLLVGVELVRDRKTKELFPDDQAVAAEVSARALKNGVKVFGLKGHNSGMISDFLVVSPPLIITKDQIDVIVKTVDSALTEVEAKFG